MIKRFENAPTDPADMAIIDANLQSGRQQKLELQDVHAQIAQNSNNNLERDSING